METRQITQVLLWKLILNPMRGRTEEGHLVAWSDDKERLTNWYESYLTEPYLDEGDPSFDCHGNSHKWRKNFTKGSPLEWYNPQILIRDEPNSYGQGLVSEWVNEDIIPNIRSGIRV